MFRLFSASKKLGTQKKKFWELSFHSEDDIKERKFFIKRGNKVRGNEANFYRGIHSQKFICVKSLQISNGNF